MSGKPWEGLEDPGHVPDYPPSELICTPREWSFFNSMGKLDYEDGRPRIYPHDAPEKGRGPWESGWDKARSLDL